MLFSVQTGALTLRGVSLGGVYTSIHVPELGVLFDAGIPARSTASADDWFLSHGHADHVGAIASLLGIRALSGKTKPPRVYLPVEIESQLLEALAMLGKLQRYDLTIDTVGLKPGDTCVLRGDLSVRCFRTHHTVPSLGYSLFRTIKKLRPEFAKLKGADIAERRRAGVDLFREEERHELSYATDTLVQVLDHNPELYDARTLILESTFLDDRKTLTASRAGCHIHLDELIERAELFRNENLVLMHFSQLYKPSEVRNILERRCPDNMRKRLVPFLPQVDRWPG